ncbi:hypothetical protein T069G_07927 [Trichoderma breve]|uniref:Uncharacterized protein n=1 Tax=Trichoderma breve TaxID=2034170 RepID=A0A9W9E4I1_9HYPO|nr:hypothetical protein T069G_07927 [Trichoderma breve]KAJ4857030.1 hypothetical protein T069G_07927 [Trichoderma breve]
MMTAQEFGALSDDWIDVLPQLPLILASQMIEILHRPSRCVAMIGDGVNDSLSLKLADISITMGSGLDVIKESSDIILTNDNFTSILNAIEEGRHIFDITQKFVLHVLATNIGFAISLLTVLVFKDNANVSVFLSTTVETIRMLPGTGVFSETGLGFETAVPDILNPPLRHLHSRVYARYVRLRAGSMLGSFTTVIFGFGDGSLGLSYNNAYSPSCHDVFRALATVYTAMMWIFLLSSRSSFRYAQGRRRVGGSSVGK